MDFPKSVSGVGLEGGVFVDENPVLGTKGSLIPSAWGNAVTQEILAVLAAAGVAPVEGDNDQMAGAIASLIVAALGNVTTPPQFDNDKSAVNSEFVQRALGNSAGLTVLSASTALTAIHCGRLLQCFGGSAAAITLPPSASLAVGAVIKLWSNATAPFVVYPQGADTITDGVTIPATVTVNTGDSVTFEYKGGGSWIMQGALQLGRASSIFGSSLAASGYQKLPSGLIVQWGTFTASATAGNPVAVTHPIAFTNIVLSLVLSQVNNGLTTVQSAWADTPTLSGFNGRANSANTTVRWVSIGF